MDGPALCLTESSHS